MNPPDFLRALAITSAVFLLSGLLIGWLRVRKIRARRREIEL